MLFRSLGIARDFPLFGTGAGTFADAMARYQQSATYVLFNQAHNEYLHLLAEGGLVGMVVYGVAAACYLAAARRALQDDTSPQRIMRVAALAALAGVAVQSLFETGLRTPANLLLFVVTAAIAIRSREPQR